MLELTKLEDRLRLTAEQCVPKPLAEVFGFFAEPQNLGQITPPWLSFRIVSPLPIEMRVGALIDYRIKVHGLPMKWRTRITEWEPGVRFVDEQLRGPYKIWHHEHRFAATEQGTLVTDIVHFQAPLRALTHAWVSKDVTRIFEYRQKALMQRFPAENANG